MGNQINQNKAANNSNFTQVIHITQNESLSTAAANAAVNQKTQDILIQNLNEKSREIAILKRENKDLQERLF